MGGWDDTNPVNSYYKDLIVTQRYLSDAEVNVLLSSMRSGRDATYVSQLIEGAM
jgi:hypothetical protein